MRLEDVTTGFQYQDQIGVLFGENCTFFTGMAEGINASMNLSLLASLQDPATREALYAEVLIQGVLSGRSVDPEELAAGFQNQALVEMIQRYLRKTSDVSNSKPLKKNRRCDNST